MDHEKQALMDFHSKKRLDVLKRRSKRCVCKYCGGPLVLKRIIFSSFEDARVEIFCKDCARIEYGVEPAIYQSARYFVEHSGFNCFPDLDGNERTKQMTISKVCEIMAWQDQNFGILNENGFTIPLAINENQLGACVTFTEDDLDDVIIEDLYSDDVHTIE